MNRQEKASLVKVLKDDFTNSEASFLVGYKGLSVSQMQILRRDICPKGGKLKIAKNRIVKLAIGEVDGACDLHSYLKDQLGVVFATSEFHQVAKVLVDFSKKNPALSVVVGCLDSEVIDKDKISVLALLPSKDVLLAQLCGTINAPASGIASVMNTVVLKLLCTIKKVSEKNG